MESNPVKQKVQAEANEIIHKNNGTGIIAIATGGGKSKIAIDYMRDLLDVNPEARFMLLVPTKVLRDDDWGDEFRKWGAEDIWENHVRSECYIYADKVENDSFDLVIMDELQHITPHNAQFFQQNEHKAILGLSATPPVEKDKKEILESFGMKVLMHIPVDEAVEIGLISPYKLTLIEMDLNKSHYNVEAGTRKRKWMTTETRHYDYLTQSIERARRAGARGDIMKWKYLHRMRFIYNMPSKQIVAKYVLDNIIPEDERTLIFTGSIKSAEGLCENFYHSKVKKDNTSLADFREKKINRLSCVNSLNEGVNIKNVDNAFVVQINQKERRLIQRMGRILRYEKDHVGHIYLLYVKDTVDENWMKDATKNIDPQDVTHLKLSTNGPKK